MLRTILFIVVLGSCAPVPTAQPRSGPAKTAEAVRAANNKELVLRFYAALNAADWTQLDSMVSSDYRHYIVVDTGFRSVAWSSFKNGNLEARKAFPDWSISPTAVVAEDEYVFALVAGSGTHRGAFAGIPATGRTVRLPLAVLHRVVDGKLVADWEVANADPAMQTLRR